MESMWTISDKPFWGEGKKDHVYLVGTPKGYIRMAWLEGQMSLYS